MRCSCMAMSWPGALGVSASNNMNVDGRFPSNNRWGSSAAGFAGEQRLDCAMALESNSSCMWSPACGRFERHEVHRVNSSLVQQLKKALRWCQAHPRPRPLNSRQSFRLCGPRFAVAFHVCLLQVAGKRLKSSA